MYPGNSGIYIGCRHFSAPSLLHTMQSDRSRSYPDQPPFGYSASQVATSYAGSMSDVKAQRMVRDEDTESRATVYTSYGTQEEGQVRREGGRVRYNHIDRRSLNKCLKGVQHVERNLLYARRYGVSFSRSDDH